MNKRLFLIGTAVVLFIQQLTAQNMIDLAGQWQVQLDTTNELIINNPSQSLVSGHLNLPSSLAESGYGFKTEGSDFGILTPEFKYVGKAWYKREIIIPAHWENKSIELFLERVLWKSVVSIDGISLSEQDALGTPHYHHMGRLSPGKHELMIMVDNDMIHNIGDKGHAYGEYTQSIWNGIAGRLELRAYDPIKISSAQVFPDIESDVINLKFEVTGQKDIKARLEYEIVAIFSNKVHLAGKTKLKITKGTSALELKIPVANRLELWSEYNPKVYILKLHLTAGKFNDRMQTEFGYYQVSHDGTKILINGKPTFLRGNLDCVHFPLTGYASCKIEDWERIFNIYKSYGLNHARFHSWCPPEAAFKAANRAGIYLQAEASIWIDWWMSEDMNLRGRPEMDTKGHPKGLGYDPERDRFVIDEMNRMIEEYGNHPSFTMFCIGNELGNSDFEAMEKWVANLKAKDPRRLYAVSTARKITDSDDYNATHYIQGLGRTRGLNGSSTDWDFEEVYSKMKIPIIAHEIGQWPVYPKWSEIKKYSGVLKARNFEEFRAQARRNGIADQDEQFALASGALNQLMYKYEIESFLRTRSCAGVQLLSMQDYQGQGEALIGWLDSHWESKGITTPEDFKQHFNTTVPLLRMKKFVWTNDEKFVANAQLSHHGPEPLQAKMNWKVTNENNQIISNGTFGEHTIRLGQLASIGEIQFDLGKIARAEKLTVTIEVDGTTFKNRWDFWVYPNNPKPDGAPDVLVARQLDAEVKQTLENGGKVLLIANELGTDESSTEINFYPLYWSLTFFPGQGKTNIGLLLKDDHPAFAKFPTSFHSDWQWESISNGAKGFILNDLPIEYKPIAQPVDDFHRNNKLGSIFEFRIGKGALLVCGYDATSDLPVARQLKKSLMDYMSSSDFDPNLEVSYTWLEKKLPSYPLAQQGNVPDRFEGAVLYVNAAMNTKEQNLSIPWSNGLDEVIIANDANYKAKVEGVWKDENGAAWYGKNMELEINCPEGITGTLYIFFDDWNNKGRTGLLTFEGRKSMLGSHANGGQWIKFHVMREDSNDGRLILKTKVRTGGNLMISKIALIKED